MMEVWRDIPGFEGFYQVSNNGNVRSCNRVLKRKNGVAYRRTGQLLKPKANNMGYMRVSLSKDDEKSVVFVHRLVATVFIENPSGLCVVNHKDFNPKNNAADNLEWTDFYGNYHYSADAGRFDRTAAWKKNIKKGLALKMGKPVVGTRISDNAKIRYECLNDCKADGFEPSCVSGCCNGQRKTHAGYTWEFAK